MTDQEKRELSERIATLAEQAGLPGELVWRKGAGYLCNAGHEFEMVMPDGTCAWPGCRKKTHRADVLPRDLTNPTHLLPLVEAYCDLTGNGWDLHRYFDPEDGIEAYFYAGIDREWVGKASHGHPMDALAQALWAALESAKEQGK